MLSAVHKETTSRQAATSVFKAINFGETYNIDDFLKLSIDDFNANAALVTKISKQQAERLVSQLSNEQLESLKWKLCTISSAGSVPCFELYNSVVSKLQSILDSQPIAQRGPFAGEMAGTVPQLDLDAVGDTPDEGDNPKPTVGF